MTKCYFSFCNNRADKQVVTSFSMGATKYPNYNYVCDYHIKNINWTAAGLKYPYKKDKPEANHDG